jgi:hypothetical protein
MSVADTEARIRRWAAERRLERAHVEAWLALEESDRSALLNITEALRLHTGQFVKAFAMLSEIAVREHERIAAILARGEIRRILDRAGSVPGKAHALVEQLRAIRFPRLKETTDRLAVAVAELSLPRGISVGLPHDLASDELRIEIVARGGEEMEMLIDAITKSGAGLRRLVEMLGGMHEV